MLPIAAAAAAAAAAVTQWIKAGGAGRTRMSLKEVCEGRENKAKYNL
jgi:hypothetical protein